MKPRCFSTSLRYCLCSFFFIFDCLSNVSFTHLRNKIHHRWGHKFLHTTTLLNLAMDGTLSIWVSISIIHIGVSYLSQTWWHYWHYCISPQVHPSGIIYSHLVEAHCPQPLHITEEMWRHHHRPGTVMDCLGKISDHIVTLCPEAVEDSTKQCHV